MRYILLLWITLIYITSQAQVLETVIAPNDSDRLANEFLKQIEKDSQIKFFYLTQWLDNIVIDRIEKPTPLIEVLDKAFLGTDLSYTELDSYAIILLKNPTRTIEREAFLNQAKVEEKIIESISVGNPSNSRQGKHVTIQGVITDSETKENLGGVLITIDNPNISYTSDQLGQFSIPSILLGRYILTLNALGYTEKIIDVKINDSGILGLTLTELPKFLDEVEVNAQRFDIVQSSVGHVKINLGETKKLPTFLGEVDLIKQIQTLPGVTTSSEMSSGFNVRGGSVDQNLVLLDGVPVFNNAHAFGFFSAFNSEVIKDAAFYKGGIPANYGGRVSSVLSVSSKEGNLKKWEGKGGIGVISSQLSIGGPIKKDTTSVIFSFRTSYSDWILRKFLSDYPSVKNSSVSFYDFSTKVIHKLNSRNKISLNAYFSNDHFGLPSDTTFKWSNVASSIHWDHIFNDNLFSHVAASVGQYTYNVSDTDPITAYRMKYSLLFPSISADLNYLFGKNKILAGLSSTYYKIAPGSLTPTGTESSTTAVALITQHSFETSFFLSSEIFITEKLTSNIGLRLSIFNSVGSGDVYTYESGVKEQSTLIDTLSFAKNEIIKSYIGPEPRVSFIYLLGKDASLKLGYDRAYQYLHLLSNSVAITPIDIWQPSGYHIKPQISDQISLGYFTNLKNNRFEASIEAFYKNIKNVLDFKDGAELVLNKNIERTLLNGNARSYGVEFSLTKTTGRLTSSANYTYSRSVRKFKSNYEDLTINEGKYFPSNFDQPNVVNFVWEYRLSKRFSFTGNFAYRTGRPITVPYSYGVVEGIPVVNFGDRNEYRVPDYHRLDLAILLEGNHKRQKFGEGSWALSLYNVYSRRNVYSIFYKKNENGILSAYRMSIIGSLIPSISYRFKF